MVASKKPKFAKNRRKGWKKVNIDEINEFYDDNVRKEIVGQPLDEPAFKIDKEAAVEPEVVTPKKFKKLKTTKDLAKNITAFKALIPASRVPPVVVHKSEPQKRKVKEKIYGKSIKKKKEEWKDLKVSDIWADGVTPKRAEMKTRLKTQSVLPSVELPHPGTSINPSAEEYQNLLKQAAEIEAIKLKKEENQLKKLAVPKKTPSQMQKIWLEEMSAGLPFNQQDEDEDDETEANNEDPDFTGIKKVIRATDVKSKSKRRREMLAKMREKAIKVEKEKKKRENKIYQLKRLKKEIAAEEEKSKGRLKIYQKKFEEKLKKPARIGPHKYEEPDMPVTLPHELTDRLRSSKPDGDLFEDRFKSLQKRNIIEPRKLILKTRKKNVKWTEKRDCRDDSKDLLIK